MHLFGIFYYRSLDARARRVAKTVQDAARLAEKSPNKRIDRRQQICESAEEAL